MKLVLISNPASGRSRKEKIEQAVEILRNGGVHEVLLQWTEKPRDGIRLAREAACQGADAVIAAGGDGTINEVLNGLAGTPTPMGVIPLGTANCYALEVGIPLDAGRAAKAILDSERISISLGKTGETFFLLMAGIGYDAEVVHRLEDALSWKRKLGKAAYLLIGLKRLAVYRPPRLRVIMDGGEPVEGYSVIIGNARSYGGQFHVTPLADLDEETLDVCLFQRKDRRSMLRYGWGILRGGKHIRFRDVVYRKCRTVRIESEEPSPMQLDGDRFGHTPAAFELAPRALQVLIPKSRKE